MVLWSPVRRAEALTFVRVMRRYQIDQRVQRNDFIYLLQKCPLAGFLQTQAQLMVYLFHGSMMLGVVYARHTWTRILQLFFNNRYNVIYILWEFYIISIWQRQQMQFPSI